MGGIKGMCAGVQACGRRARIGAAVQHTEAIPCVVRRDDYIKLAIKFGFNVLNDGLL